VLWAGAAVSECFAALPSFATVVSLCKGLGSYLASQCTGSSASVQQYMGCVATDLRSSLRTLQPAVASNFVVATGSGSNFALWTEEMEGEADWLK